MPSVGSVDLRALVSELANRTKPGRTEADVQSGIKVLLLAAPLNLSENELDDQSIMLEAQAGYRRRIDIEVGATVIEVKKNLKTGKVLEEAVVQLAGYVAHRAETVGRRYVGVLTDGADWHLYSLDQTNLRLVSSFQIENAAHPNVDGLLVWLEGVLATTSRVHPTPKEIETRLGANSSGHRLDSTDLAALYHLHHDKASVKLKRELWGRLLTTALGTAFEDTDELFVNHTLLVLEAEIIAHAVIGYDLTDPNLSPPILCSGGLFAAAQIGNVVEADFFDWPVEVPGGDRFVRALARRMSRFSWDEVKHDVMKVLYESVISAEQRHSLGEYYTPDWLAERIVDEVVTQPLEMTVLDPSCGSGTFLFHAVSRYLAAADAAGLSNQDALSGVCIRVTGMDVHPVAVAFARVTYLLAIGKERLEDRPLMSVPVYLGDSVQWDQEVDLLTADALVIDTKTSTLLAEPLRFPRRLLDDPGNFDRLVTELADKAASSSRRGTGVALVKATFTRHRVRDVEVAILHDTFRIMCDLHDMGRNHIWGYFVRNLARPVWRSRPENRVDALVGNPPWLSYRFMPKATQEKFRRMVTERGMWAGAAVATQQDLSALFVARACELYLRKGGHFGFVLPLAALSRKQFAGFRTGSFEAPLEPTFLSFSTPWDLHQVKPSIFPVPPSVVFGSRASRAGALTSPGKVWSGRVPKHNASWSEARAGLAMANAGPSKKKGPADVTLSPYAARFGNGATVFPRILFVVENAPKSPLGAGPGRRAIQSRRSSNEKAPWKSLKPITGSVEKQFIFPMHLGETIAPFRLQTPLDVVLPWDGKTLFEEDDAQLDEHPGLADWWRKAAKLWNKNRTNDSLSLRKQLDYRKKLTVQFPAPPHRVVYTKGGMYLAAARVDDPRVVIDHKLYWAAVDGPDEGRYLTAVLNSDVLTLAVRPLQARGEHNPRDFDKYLFQLPIPLFDPTLKVHLELVKAAEQAEKIAAGVNLPKMSFQAQRKRIREALELQGVAEKINSLVGQLLGLTTKAAKPKRIATKATTGTTATTTAKTTAKTTNKPKAPAR